jgi:predicted GIY-YIG superfamily endonuclease
MRAANASAREAGCPSVASAKEGCLFYVYLIESIARPGERYVGFTSDLKQRLSEHNAGKSAHTAKFQSWRLITYVAFSDEAKARAFERYVKSGSGHAFARKRLW